jgi:hypothetical protein
VDISVLQWPTITSPDEVCAAGTQRPLGRPAGEERQRPVLHATDGTYLPPLTGTKKNFSTSVSDDGRRVGAHLDEDLA